MISVSVLSSCDRVKLVRDLNWCNTDLIHIDVKDGEFVEGVSCLGDELLDIIDNSLKRIDIHLMSNNPIRDIKKLDYFPKLKRRVSYVTFHFEIGNVMEHIQELKRRGYKVGIAISPSTNIDDVIPYFKYIDLVLLLAVEPGMSGASFIPETLNKVKAIRKVIDNYNYEVLLEVDGGIKDYNASEVIDAGADILVVGSYVTESDNMEEKINIIRKLSLKKLNIFFK